MGTTAVLIYVTREHVVFLAFYSSYIPKCNSTCFEHERTIWCVSHASEVLIVTITIFMTYFELGSGFGWPCSSKKLNYKQRTFSPPRDIRQPAVYSMPQYSRERTSTKPPTGMVHGSCRGAYTCSTVVRYVNAHGLLPRRIDVAMATVVRRSRRWRSEVMTTANTGKYYDVVVHFRHYDLRRGRSAVYYRSAWRLFTIRRQSGRGVSSR